MERHHPETTVGTRKTIWFSILFFSIMCSLFSFALCWMIFSFVYYRMLGKEFWLFFVGVLLLGAVVYMFGTMAYKAFLGRKDYITFSDKGIDMNLHSGSLFSRETGSGFISWKQIEQCGVREYYDRTGRRSFLLLQLKGEEFERKYDLGNLRGDGQQIHALLQEYAPKVAV